jgi:hypothetical protein
MEVTMRSLHRILAGLGFTVAGLFVATPTASATGTISIDGVSNYTESQTITVRYKGFTLYERVYFQQCWNDPSEPDFDYSTSCAADNMVFPGLIDRDEGTIKFQLFVGDEPSGGFNVACGPKTEPTYTEHETCWIRAAMSDRARNDLAASVPLTFRGAVPVSAAPTTVPPASTSTAVSSSASSKPSATATILRATPSRRPFYLKLVGLGAGFVALFFVADAVFRRRRRRPEPHVPVPEHWNPSAPEGDRSVVISAHNGDD